MRVLFTVLIVFALGLFTPSPALQVTKAYADDVTYEEGAPKQGYSGFLRCEGYAKAGGDSYTNIYYEGFDADQPVASERKWQISECDMVARRSVVGYFKYTKGVDIDPASVKVSYRLMP